MQSNMCIQIKTCFILTLRRFQKQTRREMKSKIEEIFEWIFTHLFHVFTIWKLAFTFKSIKKKELEENGSLFNGINGIKNNSNK